MPPLPPDAPPPVLEVFYSPSCAPCQLELPAVAHIAGQQDVRVRIFILDQEDRARSELSAVSPGLAAVAESPGSQSPGDALRAAGDARGILPYARTLSSSGEACASWSGGLTIGRVKSLVSACARLLTSPRRSPS